MMLKPSSSSWMRWSYLAMIPVLAAFMFACNSPKSNNAPASEPEEQAEIVEPEAILEQEAVPYNSIEVKPTFNGEDSNAFSKWVNSQLKYPENCKNEQIQGRVTIQFTIGADGVLRDAVVLRGAHEELDSEALRVINSSPKWEPGRDAEGNPVPVKFVFPVVYMIR